VNSISVHIEGGRNILATQEVFVNQLKADMKGIDEATRHTHDPRPL